MTFRKSAPAALIAAVVIVVAGLTFLSSRLFAGLTGNVEAAQFQLMQAIAETRLKMAADEALARADIIAALPETRQALAAKDRDRLLADYRDMYAVQKNRRGIDQAQFVVPPAQSLLRLHNPAASGDDLTRFRPMVAAVMRDQAPRSGLAIARRGPAVFGVTPVMDEQGKLAGTFEFGLAFEPVLDGIKSAYGLDVALFIAEKPLKEFARGLDPARLSDQNRVGAFIRMHATNLGLMSALAEDSDIAAVKEPTRYTREVAGLPYGVLLLPLRDAAGDSLGVLALARDFSGSRAASTRTLIWQLCLGLFAIVILAGVVIVVVRGFLLRPLDAVNARFAAWNRGEDTGAPEGHEQFCREIRDIVDWQEGVADRARTGAPR